MSRIELLKILSEPLRLRILNLTRQAPLSVSELVEILNVSQSNVSHHLRLLKDQNLLQSEKFSAHSYYSSAEPAALPVELKKLWESIPDMVRELSSGESDNLNLKKIIDKREHLDFKSWRKLQPDLPYTEELARAGISIRGCALDAGCGDGSFTYLLSESFSQVIGIDVIDKFSQNTDRCTFLQADAEALPFAENTFSAVYFRMTFNFIDRHEQVLHEAARVLIPGGRLAAIELKERNHSSREQLEPQALSSGFQILQFKEYPAVQLFTLQKPV